MIRFVRYKSHQQCRNVRGVNATILVAEYDKHDSSATRGRSDDS